MSKWRCGIYEAVTPDLYQLSETHLFDSFAELLAQCLVWRREQKVVRIRAGAKLPATIDLREENEVRPSLNAPLP